MERRPLAHNPLGFRRFDKNAGLVQSLAMYQSCMRRKFAMNKKRLWIVLAVLTISAVLLAVTMALTGYFYPELRKIDKGHEGEDIRAGRLDTGGRARPRPRSDRGGRPGRRGAGCRARRRHRRGGGRHSSGVGRGRARVGSIAAVGARPPPTAGVGWSASTRSSTWVSA